MNPIDMVDYIFDRYAYLGLPTTASDIDIRRAIKERRSENHPDRLIKTGEEVQNAATKVLNLLAACEEVLLHPKRKAHFDERLTWFKTHRPKGVSNNGTMIMLLDAPSFNLPTLLGQKAEALDDSILNQMRILTGVDPAKTAKLRKLFATTGDSDVKEMLIQALQAELNYLDALEEDAWQRAGIHNKPNKMKGHLHSPSDYTERTTQELERTIAEDVPDMLTQTLGLAQLGMATPMLLLTGPSGASLLPAKPEDITLDTLMAQVKATMATNKALIADLATQKQAVLAELADLTDLQWFTPLPGTVGPFTILLMIERSKGNEPVVFIAVDGDDTHTNLKRSESHPAIGLTASQIAEISFACDTIGVKVDPENGHLFMMVEPAVIKRRQAMGLPPMVKAA
jgi:hypothetical protein